MQAGLRLRMGNQVHDYGQTLQGPAAPVLTDERKQPMLNLIPLAGPRREVADVYRHPGLVGPFLERTLPQPGPVAVAAAGIGRDQQLAGPRVAGVPQLLPPTPDTGHGEL